MSKNVNAQHADQTVKGGLLGVFTYLAMNYSIDPGLTAMLIPLLAGFLSYVSSKIGDPALASLIGSVGKDDGKPLKVAGPRKVTGKKPVTKK